MFRLDITTIVIWLRSMTSGAVWRETTAFVPEERGDSFGSTFGIKRWNAAYMSYEYDDCDECGCTQMSYAWPNYNYRICTRCWEAIKYPLWDVLESKLTGRPANVVWSFLVEPGFYPIWCLSTGRVRRHWIKC